MSYFWKKFKLPQHTTPNQFFFRFLTNLKFIFKKKKVLEIGFLNGDDLLELKKRGCDIYGIEINKSAVNKIKNKQIKNILNADISLKEIPFKKKFDLIFHNDLIYYLDDETIKKHFNDVYNKLKKNGIFIFSFIENEAISKKTPKSIFDLLAKINKTRVTEKNNPIRILKRSNLIKLSKKFNFKLFGEKIILESFDNFSKKYKIHRYIALKK